ncbi:interferon lambda receptor 1 [Discoglossus pictus]
MSDWVLYAVLIMQCLVPQTAGFLHPPLNVTTVSRNLRLILTWLPAPENPEIVTYRVSFTSIIIRKWKTIQLCSNITTTECDLTCYLSDYSRNHSVRIRTLYKNVTSSWTTIQWIAYMFTVDPDPPILQLKQKDDSIFINATIETPSCFGNIYDLKYDTMVWLDGNLEEKYNLRDQRVNSEVVIEIPGLKGNYCVAAKTKYSTDTIKWSKYSSPVCLLMTYKGPGGYDPFMIIGFTIPLFLVFCGLWLLVYKIWKTHPEKMPEVLDFTQYKCPQIVSTPESKERFLEKYSEFTIEQRKEQSLVSHGGEDLNEDEDTSCNFGYTEKRKADGETKEDGTSSESTGYKHGSSRGLLIDTSSDKCSVSDFSGGEYEHSSGQTIQIPLGLLKIQSGDSISNKTKSRTEIAEPVEFQLAHPVDLQAQRQCVTNLCQLIERQCMLTDSNKQNVCFSSLLIADSSIQMENSDGESSNQFLSDSEDSTEPIDEDLLDNDIDTYSYTASKNIGPQNIRCTGYEQRSYMSRKC